MYEEVARWSSFPRFGIVKGTTQDVGNETLSNELQLMLLLKKWSYISPSCKSQVKGVPYFLAFFLVGVE